jgi:hypothetical protein
MSLPDKKKKLAKLVTMADLTEIQHTVSAPTTPQKSSAL